MKTHTLPHQTRAIALAVTLGLATLGTANAATISLTQNGQYFNGWSLSNILPDPGLLNIDPAGGGYNCFSGPQDLPTGTVIKGTLGPLNYQVTALTPATPPADNQWQICNWYWGSYIPSGNATTGAPGSMNYNKGTYDIVADRPFVPGTLMAFQDMDAVESALLTFKDCQGNVVDPVAFDTLVLSSLYTSTTAPIASSQYVGGSTPAWKFQSQSPSGVPNVSIGLLMNAPNICSIHLVGPTIGGSGGTAFFFAAPQATTLTVNTTITGGPAGFSAAVPVGATCTVGDAKVDISGMLSPQPPQPTTASASTPGQVVFSNIPIGAQCTVKAVGYPDAPAPYAWGAAPADAVVTLGATAASNTATLTRALSFAAVYPQPDKGIFQPNQASTPVVNVTANDFVNGAPAALGTGGNATVSPVGSWPAGFTLDPQTGAVNVAPSAPATPQVLSYELCDRLVPAHCTRTTVTLTPAVTAVPALGPWSLLGLLGLLAATGALRRQRRS